MMVQGLWGGFRTVIPASLPKVNRTHGLPQDNLHQVVLEEGILVEGVSPGRWMNHTGAK